uniref:RRM domain-containing protein n=1 Tax=Cannabis sativa TaxID=3483 RepID=A0A803PZB0_CANSA
MASHSSSAAPSSAAAAAAAAAAASSQYTYANGSSYFPLPFHLQQPQTVSQYPTPYASVAPQPAPPPVVAPVYPASAPVAGVYTLPQYQQAQQLFQRDAQTITPEALESVKAALANSEIEHKAEAKKKAVPRKAAGLSWEDPTLAEWPEKNDYRLFCGDLGNEVNDDVLSKAFSRFPSFNMAKVVRDKRTGKTKGYGFVSFANPTDLAAALKEMNGKYVGNRPIKLRKSNWKERTDYDALERHKHHTQKRPKLSKKSILHK